MKDKRDNLNEPAALAELSVVDTTPPRLLETQDNVYGLTSYTLRFDETITVKADTAAKIGAEVDGQATAISLGSPGCGWPIPSVRACRRPRGWQQCGLQP